jgi:urease accessory protein
MNNRKALLPILATALLPAPALAHPGHGGGLAAGILHPLGGADHIAAMLLVGLCATQIRDRAWLLPLSFMAGLAAGFATGAQVLSGAFVETAILASVIALGLAAMLRVAVPAGLAAGAVTAFGFAHGAAHAIELPQSAAPYLFAAGFLASSAALHAGGYWLSRKLPVPALRLIGAAGAGLGLVLAGAS